MLLALLFAIFFSANGLHAQGVLTVTPSRSSATVAGTGTAGYSGNGGGAISATLAKPGALAYDALGNLYVADENNHVIRKVSLGGLISTVAGTGVEGYSGDGASAIAAELDTPTGIAIDKFGTLYIADSHNQRIRQVSSGTITTIAGNGIKAYAGDGAAATSASLALPSGVAIDASGNVYIADTQNHRIRKITSGTISTIAGDGEQLFAGDGGIATSAALDSPTGVAIDTSGNVYIADRLNQRIREVSGGTISTIAGSGGTSFSGGFSGDGGSPNSASLAKPTGVAVDAGGNIYVADTNNQVIRQIGGGTIATIAGTPGAQGFGGDNGPATSVIFNEPMAVAIDASGNLAIADTLNQRIRAGMSPTLAFPNTAVGIDSTIQSVTLANTGTVSFTVSGIAFAGAFVTVSGGSCPTAPIVLAAKNSCTQNIAFLPATAGSASGNVVFSGSGVVSQNILLTGIGTQSATSSILSSTATTLLSGQSFTITAAIKPQGLGTPTGDVSFLNGPAILGAPVPLAPGATTALLTTTSLPDGNNLMTAVYSGDANFVASASNPVAVVVEDFTFAPADASNITRAPGQAAVFTFNISAIDGPFGFPVTLSATGLPAGATVTFNPATITLGSHAMTFTMTVVTPATAQLRRHELWRESGTVAFAALLLLPFGCRIRRAGLRLRPLLVAGFTLLGFAATVGLTGCGDTTGFFGQTQKSYTITVIGTATSGSATLQHFATVTINVE